MNRLTIVVCCLLMLPALVLDLFFSVVSVLGGGPPWPLSRKLAAAISEANARMEAE